MTNKEEIINKIRKNSTSKYLIGDLFIINNTEYCSDWDEESKYLLISDISDSNYKDYEVYVYDEEGVLIYSYAWISEEFLDKCMLI